MKSYHIHGLVNINLDLDTAVSLCDELEFKYKFFDSERHGSLVIASEAMKVINVFPYDKRNIDDVGPANVSHDFIYSDNVFCGSRRLEVFVKKGDDGFDVYTNGLNIIDILLQILLCQCGHTLVHAGGVEINSEGVLLAGMGGIGKTQVVSKLSEREGVAVLGDDLIIVSDRGHCLAFPKPFMLKPQHAQIYPSLFKFSKYRFKFREVKNSSLIFLKENLPFSGVLKTFFKKDNPLSIWIRSAFLINVADLIPMYPWELPRLKISEGVRCRRLIFVERSLGIDDVFNSGDALKSTNSLASVILSEHESTLWVIPWLAKAGMIDVSSFYASLNKIMGKFAESCAVTHYTVPISMDSAQYIERMIGVVDEKAE